MSGGMQCAAGHDVGREARTRQRALPAAALLLTLAVAGCAGDASLQDAVVVASSAAHSPTVALDAAGDTAYVAWVSGDSVHDVLLARVRGSHVEPPVRVNDIAGDAAPHAQAPAQVALGRDGHVYVVWQNNTHVEGRRFPASDLRFARSTDGGRTFEPAIHVNDDAGGPPASHTFHDVAVSADGTIYVSWIDSRGRSASMHGGHGAPAATSGGAATPVNGADATPEIRVARSRDGGRTFESSVVVAPRTCPCCRTSLAVDGSDVYVAWRDVDEQSVRNVVVARSRDGGATWDAPVPVHADDWRIDGCPHAGPALALTDDGRIHVAWYTGAPGRPGIHYAVADTALQFGAPRPLLAGEWVPPSLVALAAAGDRVIAAWDDRRNEQPVLALARDADADRAARTAGLAPAIAAAAGTRILAWLRGDSILVQRGEPR